MKINKLAFYLKKVYKDFTNPLKYQIANEYFNKELKHYYFLFDEELLLKGGSQEFYFDKEGIPIIPEYIDISTGKEKKFHYFPISIGQYGLAIFHSFLREQSKENEERFLKIVKWFSENQNEDGTWRANVPVPKFKLKKNWASGMAQSRGISILLRGYQLTSNELYKKQAEKALEIFKIKVESDGILDFYKENPYYEEYPSKPDAPHVLNGMIFALFGLHEFSRLGNQRAKELFDQGIKTLENTLSEYDLGFWTKYDVADEVFKVGRNINSCTAHYHNIHIKQLEVLYNITKNEIIKEYFEKWEKYENNKINLLKAYFIKFKFLKQVLEVKK
ncbi:D-glucuronyl C5-epimerase family protein [Psychrilyobacter sp.]|uniref:D-glucuronyl C5-epimerase family protein n=1 Tax=Psychrilyobacter sp. TaxID=2586924 RepID=UPI00301B472E